MTVNIVQFIWIGLLPKYIVWLMLVLITKDESFLWCIGIIEVLWKLVEIIINKSLKYSIEFCNALHGFRSGRGTGTTTIEEKPLHKIDVMWQQTLYDIFLDIHKAYDTLNMQRALNITVSCGVGERTIRLLRQYRKGQKMVVWASG